MEKQRIEVVRGDYVDTISEGTRTSYWDPGEVQTLFVKRGWKLVGEKVNDYGHKVQIWEKE
jgi:hypothetical protein